MAGVINLRRSPTLSRAGGLSSSKGFTLIEIAIVLIIIGLLLGGVLKGQELINSAKAKNIAQDFRNIQVAIYGYQDKYRAIPGDDNNATRHDAAGTAVSPVGSGTGKIEGSCGTTTPAVGQETPLVWRDLRLGGFVVGDASKTDYQKNALGGKICIASEPKNFIKGLSGNFVVCSANIPGDLAQRVDTQLDDGKANTGSVMATAVDIDTLPIAGTAGGTGGADVSPAYDNSTNYTLCFGF